MTTSSSTIVTARLAPGRELADDDFVDLTPTAVSDLGFAGDGRLQVTFAGDLDVDTVAAVKRRIVSATAAEEDLRSAIAANAAVIDRWPAQSTITNAALFSRMRTLTDQVRALTQLVQPADDPTSEETA